MTVRRRGVLVGSVVAVTGYTLSSLADRSTGAAHAQTLNGPVDGRIGDAGVTFEWRHEDGILVGLLTAPTAGWIAVGFNETPDLRNTRMVMAAVSVSPIRVEEHVALVPDHRPVGQLGQPPIVTQADGAYADSLSTLAFAVTHDVPGRPSLRLSEGANVGVMLAWSHEPDFDHHSAWRRHFPVTL